MQVVFLSLKINLWTNKKNCKRDGNVRQVYFEIVRERTCYLQKQVSISVKYETQYFVFKSNIVENTLHLLTQMYCT